MINRDPKHLRDVWDLSPSMSGHSKWSQIKHKKSLTDKKRSQVFSKLSRLITLAARKGVDPKSNISLVHAIEQAKASNMPGDNIERAIKRVTDKKAGQLEEIQVEAMGPGGIALKIKAVTDNRNRTLADIKTVLSEHSSKMVQPGSMQWMFSQPPVVITDQEILGRIEKLFESLDDQDEVEDVISNLQ